MPPQISNQPPINTCKMASHAEGQDDPWKVIFFVIDLSLFMNKNCKHISHITGRVV